LQLAGTIERGLSRLVAYARSGMDFKRRKDLEGTNLDLIVFENDKLRISGLYRPFKLYAGETAETNFLHLMNALKEVAITNQKQLICGGDFNIDWLKESRR